MTKRVRFAPVDEHKFWLTDKPVSEVSLTNQPLGYCLKCNTVKYASQYGNRCMNCFVPKSAIKKTNSNREKKTNLLFSKSADNLTTRSRSTERSIQLEFPNSLHNNRTSTSSFIHGPSQYAPPKPHELENINENLYNRYVDTFDLKIGMDEWRPKTKPRNNARHSIWKCEKCSEILHPGEIAISAEYADPLARWHPKCFSCQECNELLTDLLYYNHENQIYCKKHFEIFAKPKVFCAACDTVIETNEYVKAEDNFWHKEHFVCWDCENSLAGKKYIVSHSKPFCLDCHTKSFSKKCNSCNWTIPPESIRLTYENIDWHASPNCFKCFACHKNLLESQFLLKNSLLFCSLDCKRRISVI